MTEPAASPSRASNAYYGRAQALEDVSFEMGKESIAIIGRNGMGKTTLCNAIMGIAARRRRRLDPLPGRGARRQGRHMIVASLGIGYVPQGRRLFPSLTVDEHLRMIRPARESRVTEALDDRRASTSSSRASPSASGTAARSSRAASSRCSRSGARC